MSDLIRRKTDLARLLATTTLAALCLTSGLLSVAPAQAEAATCASKVPYPGNNATAVQHANWMANGARLAGVPAELPVMAALVESGLRNLSYGDRDSVGFFQMRTSIWNTGQYKGYLTKPELQLKWFLDQAALVRTSHIASGKGDPALSSASYGVWIADIERPAAQYRGRYQLRLADAQALIGQSCPSLVGVNVAAPPSTLSFKHRQRPARSGSIKVRVSCPKEQCVASVSAQFRLPKRRGVMKVSSDTTMVAAGSRAHVKAALSRTLRQSVRKRLRRGMTTRARLRISVGGTTGATTVRVRKIVLAR